MPRQSLAHLISACLMAAASLSAQAQTFPRSAQTGWNLLREDRPLQAAQSWQRQAVEAVRRRSPSGLRESAFLQVLATMAYERAGDARAYASWSDAVRHYLEAGGSWEQDREALQQRWRTLERQLAQIGTAASPVLSADEQVLAELVKRGNILQYNGPRSGLVAPRDGSSDLSTITPQYMAGAGQATADEDISAPQPRYGGIHREDVRHTGPGRAGLQPDAVAVTTAPTTAPPAPPPPLAQAEPRTQDAPAATQESSRLPADASSWLPRSTSVVQSLQAEPPTASRAALATPWEPMPRRFKPRPGTARAVTTAEREMALLAWRYVQLNRQPGTGLVNGKDGYPVTTVADMAMTLGAYLAAHALQFVDPDEFLAHMRQFLSTLTALPLYNQELFNREYDSRSGRMLDLSAHTSTLGSGWAAEDIGRLLLWLRALALHSPDLSPQVDKVVARLRMQRLVAAGQLHSVLHDGQREQVVSDLRLGRQQLAAAGLSLWGIVLPQMFAYDDARWSLRGAIAFPADRRPGGTVATDVFARGIIETGGLDGCFEAAAHAALQAQHRLAEERGAPVMVADELLDRAPWFVHGLLAGASAPGTWLVTDYDRQPRPELANFSLKAAHLWSAIDSTAPTRAARAHADQLETTDHGVHGGRYLSGALNRALTLDTNASVLIATHHLHRGAVPVLRVDNPVDHRCPGLQPPSTLSATADPPTPSPSATKPP